VAALRSSFFGASDRVITHERKQSVTAKTVGQKKYLDAIRKHGGKPANYCEIGGNPCDCQSCGQVLCQVGQ